MNALLWLRDALAVFSAAKNFSRNRVIGSARLNARGLHRWRMALVDRRTRARRRRLARDLPANDVLDFERDGFFETAGFLPPDAFAALRAEIIDAALPMLDMAQPPALTRRANLDAATCKTRYPALYQLLQHPALRAQLAYAAGCRGQPIMALQIIRSDGSAAGHDPQSDWHRDTFHSTAKAWLFLHDVAADQGPFAYWPGSHQLTPVRLDWEHAQSRAAATAGNIYHRRGSFRATPAELRDMDYPPEPRLFDVAANTLVVADMVGFHRRTPSPQATVRLEIYASLRRAPFWSAWPRLMDLPWIRQRWAVLYYKLAQKRLRDGRPIWLPQGELPLSPDSLERLQE